MKWKKKSKCMLTIFYFFLFLYVMMNFWCLCTYISTFFHWYVQRLLRSLFFNWWMLKGSQFHMWRAICRLVWICLIQNWQLHSLIWGSLLRFFSFSKNQMYRSMKGDSCRLGTKHCSFDLLYCKNTFGSSILSPTLICLCFCS